MKQYRLILAGFILLSVFCVVMMVLTTERPETESVIQVDNDGDGYTVADGDCDDSTSMTNPSAIEAFDDQTDNDCDGLVDSDDPDAYHLVTIDCNLVGNDLHVTINGDLSTTWMEPTDNHGNPLETLSEPIDSTADSVEIASDYDNCWDPTNNCFSVQYEGQSIDHIMPTFKSGSWNWRVRNEFNEVAYGDLRYVNVTGDCLIRPDNSGIGLLLQAKES